MAKVEKTNAAASPEKTKGHKKKKSKEAEIDVSWDIPTDPTSIFFSLSVIPARSVM